MLDVVDFCDTGNEDVFGLRFSTSWPCSFGLNYSHIRLFCLSKLQNDWSKMLSSIMRISTFEVDYNI